MSQPRQNLVHAARQMARGQGGPVDHNDRQMKHPRSSELARSASATCILGDDVSDRMVTHQHRIARHVKGSARDDRAGLTQRYRAGIDKAQQVVMLWPAGECGKVLFADGQKDTRRLVGQGGHAGIDIRHMGPVVARFRLPRRTLQRNHRGACQVAGLHGIAAHLGCERVGGIDDMGDGIALQIAHQTIHAAKAADPCRQGLRHGSVGASRIGKHRIRAALSQTLRQSASLGGAAEQKDACHG